MRNFIKLMESYEDYRFLAACTNSDVYSFLDDMIDSAKQITAEDFLTNTDSETLERAFPNCDWEDGDGVSLLNAKGIAFFESIINGHPCSYVLLGGIEYIFVPASLRDSQIYD